MASIWEATKKKAKELVDALSGADEKEKEAEKAKEKVAQAVEKAVKSAADSAKKSGKDALEDTAIAKNAKRMEKRKITEFPEGLAESSNNEKVEYLQKEFAAEKNRENRKNILERMKNTPGVTAEMYQDMAERFERENDAELTFAIARKKAREEARIKESEKREDEKLKELERRARIVPIKDVEESEESYQQRVKEDREKSNAELETFRNQVIKKRKARLSPVEDRELHLASIKDIDEGLVPIKNRK